jgi:thiol-disulfide isomerase/thioredoxin
MPARHPVAPLAWLSGAGWLLAAVVLGAATVAPESAAAPAAPAAADVVPEGTPAELFEYVEQLKNPEVKPRTREQMLAHFERVANASVQAAERILAQVKPGDPAYPRAARMKLESLMMLGQMGSERAEADLAAYAAKLLDSPDAALAREAKRCVIVAEARTALSAGQLDAVPGLVRRSAELLAADPDDAETAMLCLQFAGALEHAEGGEANAAEAYKLFAPLFAKSGNAQIREMSESIAGTLRRLSLPGKPMEIAGSLLDGSAFDQKTLAGKVVLVDFWATWCGPCIAELPNILAQYEKYHAKGFEVVGISLDEDKEALQEFVAAKKLPWPILFEKSGGAGWRHPLATKYGISGIPQLILIGRDGNVITLNARGDALAKRLADLFPDAG